MASVPYKVGSVYEDPSGVWRIIEILDGWVNIQGVGSYTGIWTGVDPKEVRHYCKCNGRRDLT